MGASFFVVLLLSQADQGWEEMPAPQDTGEWTQPFAPTTLTPPPMPLQDSRALYESAVAMITERQYGQAVTTLNALAQTAPTAELFAARCSALHSLRNYAAALADCQYALRLKPAAAIPNALYGRALAEENLGANAAAQQHYRDYANLQHPTITPELRNEALRRAASLQPMPQPMNAAAPAPSANVTFRGGASFSNTRTTNSNVGCSSSLECGSGGWCKDRGDGLKVCMNNGGHGASCSSSIDCAGGGFCKDRGDGYRVCMDSGGQGEPCNSSIDCGSGLFCRGSGVKHCE
jgi:hypothetical protein